MFMNIRPVGAELFHADGETDGQTDMTKFHFSQFCEITTNKPVLYIKFLSHREHTISYIIKTSRVVQEKNCSHTIHINTVYGHGGMVQQMGIKRLNVLSDNHTELCNPELKLNVKPGNQNRDFILRLWVHKYRGADKS